MRKILSLFLLFLFVASPSFSKTKIVATIFPFYDFTYQIVKERAEVHLLVRTGIDPHRFEPKPSDFLKIKGANFFVYGGAEIEPWASRLIKGIKAGSLFIIALGDGLDLAYSEKTMKDPHVWLDLSYVERMVARLTEELCEKDPTNAGLFRENGRVYIERIRRLDRKFQETLSSCRIKTIVHAGHHSFGYLARRYNLEYIAAYPAHMESDAQPAKVARMKEVLKKNGARFVFYEEFAKPKLAERLSKELKMGMLPLNPGHSVSKEDLDNGITFERIMESNLESLRKGLECNP